MKKLNLILAAGALGLAAASAQAAGSATGNFDVTVSLTSKCQLKGTPSPLAFSYTAFQAGSSSANTAVVFECTRGLSPLPTVQLDTATDATSGPAGPGTSGIGVVGGLQYTLVVAPTAPTPGSAATTASTGSADEYNYAIAGSMASGQAGDASKSTTQTRTLTINY